MFNYEITVVRFHNNDTDNTAYIGRGSPFGNPYPSTPTQSRDNVCDQYEIYFNNQLTNNPDFFTSLQDLHNQGKRDGYLRLGCFCKPYRCHGDTIKKFLDDNRDLFENQE